jgi:lipid-A-disaccharide synthase-like uncharacterized protein
MIDQNHPFRLIPYWKSNPSSDSYHVGKDWDLTGLFRGVIIFSLRYIVKIIIKILRLTLFSSKNLYASFYRSKL